MLGHLLLLVWGDARRRRVTIPLLQLLGRRVLLMLANLVETLLRVLGGGLAGERLLGVGLGRLELVDLADGGRSGMLV